MLTPMLRLSKLFQFCEFISVVHEKLHVTLEKYLATKLGERDWAFLQGN